MVTSFIFAIICLSLVVVTGYAGQVSLAQLTLAGVAGFLLATMTTEWSIPFPIAPILAALGATVVGVVIGLPAIRVRGLFVAVVTLAMAYAIQAVWFHNSDYVPAEGRNISGPKLFGLDLRSRVGTDYPRLAFCLVVLGVLVIVAVSVRVAATQPARFRHARRSRQRAVRRRRRHQRRPREDPGVRHRRVHRRARRRHARLQAGQPHVRPVRRPDRHRRVRRPRTWPGSPPSPAASSPGCSRPAASSTTRPPSGSTWATGTGPSPVWASCSRSCSTPKASSGRSTSCSRRCGHAAPRRSSRRRAPVSVVEAAPATAPDSRVAVTPRRARRLRRRRRRQRRQLRRRRGQHRRAHRPQRRREDHAPRRHQWLRGRIGIDPTRRPRARAAQAAPTDPGGTRTHVPADRALRRHVGAREHRRGPRRA